jgi:hypothetical protein
VRSLVQGQLTIRQLTICQLPITLNLLKRVCHRSLLLIPASLWTGLRRGGP